jgi:predicted enzyme related to lactoylglutathione lyase
VWKTNISAGSIEIPPKKFKRDKSLGSWVSLDKVIFFEIPADNPKRAREFYRTTFGWKMNEIPEMHYTQIGTVDAEGMGVRGVPKQPGAINGGLVERSDPVNNPVIYIRVDNIDQAAANIEQNGGKIVKPKSPVGNFGFAAYFRDTEGNIVGLWQFAGAQ